MARIPATIITGFLGAGKTTLLKHLLLESQGRRFAVVVNEFGEVGIDGALFDGMETPVVELPGGALCCAALGDTAQALTRLLEIPEGIERVIIETTGLADPLPLMKAFFNRPTLERNYQLDAVITVIDLSTAIERKAYPEFQSQVAAADLLILNKGESVPTEVSELLQQLNPQAERLLTDRGAIAPEKILNFSAYEEIGKKVETMSTPHAHASGITSLYLKTDKPLDLQKIGRFIGEKLVLNGDRLLRYKGIFNIAERDERFVFQGVGYTFENLPDRPWREQETRESVLVLIGENINKEEFSEAFYATVA